MMKSLVVYTLKQLCSGIIEYDNISKDFYLLMRLGKVVKTSVAALTVFLNQWCDVSCKNSQHTS